MSATLVTLAMSAAVIVAENVGDLPKTDLDIL